MTTLATDIDFMQGTIIFFVDEVDFTVENESSTTTANDVTVVRISEQELSELTGASHIIFFLFDMKIFVVNDTECKISMF